MPRKREAPFRLGVVLEVDPDVVAQPRSGDVEVVPGLIYRPGTDHLIVAMDGFVMSLAPGKRLAAALAETMTEAARRETAVATPVGDDLEACVRCGAPTRAVVLETGDTVALDITPSQSGVYIPLGDGFARLLRPFESPTVPVYRRHACGGK